MRKLLFVAVAALAAMSPTRTPATYYTTPIKEGEYETIQELRESSLRYDRPADQRQHDVRVTVAIGVVVIVAGFAFRHWRRHAADDGRHQ